MCRKGSAEPVQSVNSAALSPNAGLWKMGRERVDGQARANPHDGAQNKSQPGVYLAG